MVQMEMEEKRRYKVYKKTLHDDGYGHTSIQKTFVGDTYAVSPKKAISNVRFRLYGKKGNRFYQELGNESSNSVSFIAEPA